MSATLVVAAAAAAIVFQTAFRRSVGDVAKIVTTRKGIPSIVKLVAKKRGTNQKRVFHCGRRIV